MAEIDKQSGNKNILKGNPAWVKGGKSPNPNGRPRKDVCLTSLMKQIILQPMPGDHKNRPWREVLVERWLGRALTDFQFFRELIDRLEGKPTQAIQLDWKQEVHRLAEELNLDPEGLMKEAEAIMKSAK